MKAKSVYLRLGTIVLSLSLMQFAGCTSSKSKDNQSKDEVAKADEFQQEGADDFGSTPNSANAATGDLNAEADPFTSDLNAGASSTEQGLDASAATSKDELTLDDGGDFPSAPLDSTQSVASSPAEPVREAPKSNPSDDALFNPAPPPVSKPVDELAADPATITAASEMENKPQKPKRVSGGSLRKVADMPYRAGNTLLNRVYLARQGDNFKSVSKKIYGKDRSKDLKKWNSALAGTMKTGDKVYYNSPKSPDDEASMQNYYEENGVASSSYTTKEGDDLKVLAKQLIGSRDSWKELWATNAGLIEKGSLPADQEIRYWSGDVQPPPVQTPIAKDLPAKADPSANAAAIAPPPDAGQLPPPPPAQDLAALQPPPTETLPPAGAALPPPAAPDAAALAAQQAPPAAAPESAPPPAPPAQDLAAAQPPPTAVASAEPQAPPVVAPEKKKPKREPPPVEPEDDLTMQLGIAVLVIFAAVGGIVVMRKRKMAKQIDLGHTQI